MIKFLKRNRLLRHPAIHTPASKILGIVRRAIKPEGQAQAVVDRLRIKSRSDILVEVPEWSGAFWLSPTSDLLSRLLFTGFYEPDISEIFHRHLPGDGRDFIDVGANIGFFTVAAAKSDKVGRVLAIEPTDAAANRLRKNIEYNGVSDKVTLFQGFASDNEGETEINIVAGMEEYSSMQDLKHPAVDGLSSTKLTAPMRTIDTLVAEHGLRPGLMKIDVEGAESLAVAGCRDVLARHRPVIICEIDDRLLQLFGSSAAGLWNTFVDAGYSVHLIEDPKAKVRRGLVGNVLCLPK